MINVSINNKNNESNQIDKIIKELGDWRGKILQELRILIKENVPGVIEEIKWMGIPVWSYSGIICTGETYKKVVKLTFTKGASLPDPASLFNSSMNGSVRRAIDIHEGEILNKPALIELIIEAVKLNEESFRSNDVNKKAY